jgi:hypothetical protein
MALRNRQTGRGGAGLNRAANLVDGSHRLFIDNDRESTGIGEDCSVYWGTQVPCRASIYRSFRVVNENPESRIRWSRVRAPPAPLHRGFFKINLTESQFIHRFW